MNILFATNHVYLPQKAGGSESSTHDLCISLKSLFNCGVFCSLQSGDFLWLKNRFKSRVLAKKYPGDVFHGYSVFRGWNPIDGVEEICDSFKPDVVVVQAGKPFILAQAFLNHNVKTVVYIRDVEFHEHGGEYKHHPLLSFIANSKFTADSFQDKFGLKAKVIPPIVRVENYLVASNKSKVVFICPLPKKGVEIAFKLAELNPDIPFLFVESWPMPADLKKSYLDRTKLSGNIEWWEKKSDMRSVYSVAKLMLVPSIWEEAWGRVVTESQASGIPTIASNRGGLPESVGPGGFVLDPEDIEQWDSALKTLWFNQNLYDEFSAKALSYSLREQIKPDFLISQFINHLSINVVPK
jgi:glycosyltransferase involved in cell wall biosynthesis